MIKVTFRAPTTNACVRLVRLAVVIYSSYGNCTYFKYLDHNLVVQEPLELPQALARLSKETKHYLKDKWIVSQSKE